MASRNQKLAQAICDFLESVESETADQERVEGLQLARECITDAFQIESVQGASIKPTKLTTIFDAYLRTQTSVPAAASVSATASGIASMSVNDEPNESSADAKKRAEDCKARGNKEMTSKNFEAAIEAYTEAIAIDGNNAVYYANRYAHPLQLVNC